MENKIKELLKDIKNACNLCMENTGDCLGKICIWYDISSNAEKINRELNKKELKND